MKMNENIIENPLAPLLLGEHLKKKTKVSMFVRW
jgi:hypothetical protein